MDSCQLKIQADTSSCLKPRLHKVDFYHHFSVARWLCGTYPRNANFSVAEALT